MGPVLYQWIAEHPDLNYHQKPALSAGEELVLLQQQAEIEESPELYSGPVAMVSAFNSQLLSFELFAADYRWARAAAQHPKSSSYGLGPLSVNVLLVDQEQRYFYHQRAALSRYSGQWGLGVSSKVIPARGTEAAIASGLHNKVGIAIESAPIPEAVILFPDNRGCRVVYRLPVDNREIIDINADYYQDWLWAHLGQQPTPEEASSALLSEIISERQISGH